MQVIHKVNGVIIKAFKSFEEGETFISQMQKNIKEEIETANNNFDLLKSYIKGYLEAKNYCWHKPDEDYCSCQGCEAK